MLALFIKISAALFFAYVAVDSFFRMKRLRKEVEDDLINPKTGKMLRNRSLRDGILYLILALLSVASLFLSIAPLGE